MAADVKPVKADCFLIEGNLDYAGVLAVREKAEGFLEAGKGKVCFDLSGVERVNTAALSLLLCLMRKASVLNTEVAFIAVPEELRSIARMSDLGHLVR